MVGITYEDFPDLDHDPDDTEHGCEYVMVDGVSATGSRTCCRWPRVDYIPDWSRNWSTAAGRRRRHTDSFIYASPVAPPSVDAGIRYPSGP